MKKVKRFIAGAICPACKQKDTLRIWIYDSVSHRDCVACNFYETNSPKEVKTQVIDWSTRKLISVKDATSLEKTE